MNQTGYETNWGKAETNKHIQTESFYLHPQSLQHNSVTFGRCLVCDRRRHSERIKRWNTDTLATGGLHLVISRWVRPLDLRCFPMERSQCLSEVPGLGLDQGFCLACCSHPGRNGILRLIVKMWFIKSSRFLCFYQNRDVNKSKLVAHYLLHINCTRVSSVQDSQWDVARQVKCQVLPLVFAASTTGGICLAKHWMWYLETFGQ